MGLKGYQTEDRIDNHKIRHYFKSDGTVTIAKAIEYKYLQDWEGKPVFNLGFGDYDFTTDNITDSTVSNNNDAYIVFNTVLNTIPGFFITHPKSALIVQGSDSTEEFVEKCKENCKRNCEADTCKKKGRRIATYTGYINKEFEKLNKSYEFKGVFEVGPPVDYVIGAKYEAVLIYKK